MINDMIESEDHLELIDNKLLLPSLNMPNKSQYETIQKITNINRSNEND